MSDADTAFASIAELGARLRARTLTSVQLTELYLARIERLQPKLNAFITVTADLARAEAKRADDEFAAGRDHGPLHGIPYAVKDLVDTAYIATTWGCKAMLDRIPTRDARVITKLREAGAVLLGKLSMTELANALDNNKASTNHNGACRNPWDPTRWAGGSSAGSGAAVAAGLCAYAIGSETWGSIDCPAAFCGVTGFRPTFGVVNRDGALLICPTLDKLGPLTRSSADVALVMDALAEEPLDPAPTSALRIGVVALTPQKLPGYAEAFAATIAALGGQPIELVALPKGPFEVTTAIILFAEIYGALGGMIQRGAPLYDEQQAEKKWSSWLAMGVRADDYVKASYTRAAIQREYRTLFERYDVLVAAGRPMIAPVVDTPGPDIDYGGFGVLNTVGNLIGAPAITVPIGFSDGLPISLHAMAAPYDDRKLLALGTLLQQRTDHHRKRPPID